MYQIKIDDDTNLILILPHRHFHHSTFIFNSLGLSTNNFQIYYTNLSAKKGVRSRQICERRDQEKVQFSFFEKKRYSFICLLAKFFHKSQNILIIIIKLLDNQQK